MKPILEIQNISKKFRINHEQQPYLSLRDSFVNIFKNKSTKEDFWALKDVSFDVMPGDTIGIIGKNGAGKSTLLKILSKITPPTSGKIISRGRIASLLEVGTGFHPELSGRENVFMNGSILGMRRAEIQKNFDAIVDFAGVEKFIDEPLKHYSSGMQLRLAFAVAAFLENEILIIDEVLAVGDAEFQKKCMGKMQDVSKNGRTVLFVSHNMGAVASLCSKGALLFDGKLDGFSTITNVIDKYSSKVMQQEKNKHSIIKAGNVSLKSVYLINSQGITLSNNTVNRSEAFTINFNIDIHQPLTFNIGVLISTINGQVAFNTIGRADKFNIGIYNFSIDVPAYFLNNELFTTSISLVENHEILLKHIDNVFYFECVDDELDKDYNGKFLGALRTNIIGIKYTTLY